MAEPKKTSDFAQTATMPANARIAILDPDEENAANRDKLFTGKVATNQAYTVASVPTASENTGLLIDVSDGADGSPVMAFSNGTSWRRCDTLAVISAS